MDLTQILAKDAQMKAIEQVPSGNSNVHKVASSPQEACYCCGIKSNDCCFKEATCQLWQQGTHQMNL